MSLRVLKRFNCLVVLMLLLIDNPTTEAEDANQEETKKPAPSKERQLIDQAIKDLSITAGAESQRELKPHIVMRWPNNIRGSTDGATVIWTDRGLPRAVCCVYTWQGKQLHINLGSLADGPLVAELDEQPVWTPQEAALQFQPIPSAAEPAESARQRRRQLRALSRRFAARYYEGDKPAEALRRVPEPIYRYQLPEQDPDAQVFDGAIFAFAQGTDPEALLLIEARRDKVAGDQWFYAVARRTVGKLDVQLDRETVKVFQFGGWSKFESAATFTTFRKPISTEQGD